MAKQDIVETCGDLESNESLSVLQELIKQLSVIEDPRKARGKRYLLVEVLAIAVIGCMCGCNDAEALEDWARKEEKWLLGLLPLKHGTPGQDVFLRVLAAVEPGEFRAAFVTWVKAVFNVLGLGGQIAVDGQTHRRTGSRSTGKSPIHMVSALACESGLVLGQVTTTEKSNEITAIPELLRILHLKGALVSIDAMGAQVGIAKQIVESGTGHAPRMHGGQILNSKTQAALRLRHALQRARTFRGDHSLRTEAKPSARAAPFQNPH